MGHDASKQPAEPAPTRRVAFTPANMLTALRLMLAPVMAISLIDGEHERALAIFVVAVITDLVDGRVARRRNEVTALGGFFDHATDALFVATGLFVLADRGLVTQWLAPLLLAAFAQYTLDSRALAGRPLRASRLGRWNGIAYFVVLGVPISREGLGLAFPPDAWVWGFAWMLVATTLVSMLDRAWALLAGRSLRG